MGNVPDLSSAATTATTTPGSTVTPLDASTTADATANIEAYILAYRMLDRVAEKIVKLVEPHVKSVLIHNAPDLAALGAYRAFQGQMKELTAEYDAIAPEIAKEVVATAAAAIATVTTTVMSVIELLALFRTQRTIQGVVIAEDDVPLYTQVAGRLVAKNKSVFISQLYPVGIEPRISAGIQKLLGDVRARAVAAATRVSKLTDPQKTDAQTRLKAIDAIRIGYEELLTKVVTPDGAPFLASLLRGAAVDAKLATASVLYLKVIKTGGANETTKSLVSSRIWHSGGIIVNFVLFEKDGSVKLASTVNAYSGKMDEVPED
jgi:hypothetical protein